MFNARWRYSAFWLLIDLRLTFFITTHCNLRADKKNSRNCYGLPTVIVFAFAYLIVIYRHRWIFISAIFTWPVFTEVITFSACVKTPAYLSQHILQTWHRMWNLGASGTITLLVQPSIGEPTSPSVVSVIRHLLSGTHFLEQSSEIIHWQKSRLKTHLIYYDKQ